MQWNTEGNMSCFSIESLWDIDSISDRKCYFKLPLITTFRSSYQFILSGRKHDYIQAGEFDGGGVVLWVWVFLPVDVDVRVRLIGVRVWKFLLCPFGELRSPLCLILPHLGGIFSVFPHSSPSAPSESSLSSGLVITTSIIWQGRVGGVGCVDDYVVNPPLSHLLLFLL